MGIQKTPLTFGDHIMDQNFKAFTLKVFTYIHYLVQIRYQKH
jgi:hypothetical protein